MKRNALVKRVHKLQVICNILLLLIISNCYTCRAITVAFTKNWSWLCLGYLCETVFEHNMKSA